MKLRRIKEDFKVNDVTLGDDGETLIFEVSIRPIKPAEYVKFTLDVPEGYTPEEFGKLIQEVLDELEDKNSTEEDE